MPSRCTVEEFLHRRNFTRALAFCKVIDTETLTRAFERWLVEHNPAQRDVLYTHSPGQLQKKLKARFGALAYDCWAQFLTRFAEKP